MRHLITALTLLIAIAAVTNEVLPCEAGPISSDLAMKQANAVVWGTFSGEVRVGVQDYRAINADGISVVEKRVVTNAEFHVEGKIYEGIAVGRTIWLEIIGGETRELSTPMAVAIPENGKKVILPLSQRHNAPVDYYVITHAQTIIIQDDQHFTSERDRLSSLLSQLPRMPIVADEP